MDLRVWVRSTAPPFPFLCRGTGRIRRGRGGSLLSPVPPSLQVAQQAERARSMSGRQRKKKVDDDMEDFGSDFEDDFIMDEAEEAALAGERVGGWMRVWVGG